MLNSLLNKLFWGEKSWESSAVPNSATAAIADNLSSTKKISYDTAKNTLTIDIPKLTWMQDDKNVVKYIEEIKEQHNTTSLNIMINTDDIADLAMIHHIVNELKAEKKITMLFNLDYATYYGTEVGRLQDITNLAKDLWPEILIAIKNKETGQSLIIDEKFIAEKTIVSNTEKEPVPRENNLIIEQTGDTIKIKSLTLERNDKEQKTIDKKLAEIINSTAKNVTLEFQSALLKPPSNITYVLNTLLKAGKTIENLVFIVDEFEYNEEEEIETLSSTIHTALSDTTDKSNRGNINIIVRNENSPDQEKTIINEYSQNN